jgi:hypothetical protein
MAERSYRLIVEGEFSDIVGVSFLEAAARIILSERLEEVT